jgi:hypothetical protein
LSRGLKNSFNSELCSFLNGLLAHVDVAVCQIYDLRRSYTKNSYIKLNKIIN